MAGEAGRLRLQMEAGEIKTINNNIFREAKQLLDTKAGREMTEEELQIVSAAIIPLTVRGCPFPDDMTVGECLEELAKIVEEESNVQGRNKINYRAPLPQRALAAF